MKVCIQKQKRNWVMPIPVSCGEMVLRWIGRKHLSKGEMQMVLVLYRQMKKELKSYKGLELVEVQSAKGRLICISI